MPLVSVVVPVHNGAAYVEAAIASALSQQACDLEVIVVDDASHDQTREVVGECLHRDPRLRLVSLAARGGPSVARNAGIAAAAGTWIAVLDADDLYLPQRLARLVAAGEASGADIVCDNLVVAEEATGRDLGPMFGEQELPARIDARTFATGNLPNPRRPRHGLGFLKPMLRASFLAQHKLRYNENMSFAEDYEFLMRVLVTGASCVTVAEAGYVYTVRQRSLTANHGAADLERLCTSDELLLADPNVRADPDLRRAIGRHLITSRQRLHWVLFIDAFKRSSLPDLLRAIGHSPPVFGYVISQCIKEAGRRSWRLAVRRLQVAARRTAVSIPRS
jgi:cellulose synthase/poly-beta-1,6-N-acetylglucosamine synthase-like glycosyltransferase